MIELGSYYRNSRPEVVELVPAGARDVIDVGCGAGILGRALKDARPGIRVRGVEIMPDPAAQAEKWLDDVLCGSGERGLPEGWPAPDCVIFADVLEHMADPWSALKDWTDRLATGGSVVMSIPNVGHHSALSQLVAGHWHYEDAGIMDRTHLRFFTRRSIRKLIERQGFTVRRIEPVGLPLDAEAVLLIEVDGNPIIVEKEAAKVLEVLKDNHADSVQIAKNDAERDKLWAARRAALPALAKLRPTTYVEDATVPRNKVPDFLRAVSAAAKKHHVTIGTFGHAGDGNMHPTIVCDIRDKSEMERVYLAMDEMFKAAIALGGTLSGEHGIGLGKLPWMETQHGTVAMNTMKSIKRALDPNLILNPGKLVGEC